MTSPKPPLLWVFGRRISDKDIKIVARLPTGPIVIAEREVTGRENTDPIAKNRGAVTGSASFLKAHPFLDIGERHGISVNREFQPVDIQLSVVAPVKDIVTGTYD